ncbi:hypothetical protein H072_7600 [Dactylellina haptotyla CBS 200.50]|uniref:Uncharacterized protein n=1 Tax=Dactylellina haptotyla (strain CBS 200.50) TaxID=1284197 RepID=S8AC25_DACHA|nr:hypothetical protein H072_7600 [Dactylellina haptotyla CBS 200.50]
MHLDRALPHLNEINQYAKRKAALIKRRFKLSSADETEVFRKVTSSSKGMFLYAKVVLDNLYEQESEADLEEELAGENFPQGLKEAYDRIAVRIFDSRSPSKKKSASAERILAFVMISESRPLLWREIQSRFCIDIENASANFKRRRLDSPKTICGSLIELTDSEIFPNSPSEQVISIVHDTASRYNILSDLRLILMIAD